MAKAGNEPDLRDPGTHDPRLLRENSQTKSYRATGTKITYPGIRVFYRPHPKMEELPNDPGPLPLLVFIHGLGGSVAQFGSLLASLSNHASCLAIDLPGCGGSQFEPRSWDAYTTAALTDLLKTVILDHRQKEQGVVLIAHSMGTVLAARIANPASAEGSWSPAIVMGLVAICPVAEIPEAKVRVLRGLLWLPEILFDAWRLWDRRGGSESASVQRFTGPNADQEARKLQERFNLQSQTPVFRRMALGSLPNADGTGGLFGQPSWEGLDIPLYLIGGKYDVVTPPDHVSKIEKTLLPQNEDNPESDVNPDISDGAVTPPASDAVPSSKQRLPASIGDITCADFRRKQHKEAQVGSSQNDPQVEEPSVHSNETQEDPSTPQEPHLEFVGIPAQPPHPAKTVKSKILPAGHAMMYAPEAAARTLAGLIEDFLFRHITERYGLGWQLRFLSREGK